jgi:hypothetical protein
MRRQRMEVQISACRDAILAEDGRAVSSPPHWTFCFSQMFSTLAGEVDRLFSDLETQRPQSIFNASCGGERSSAVGV